MPHQSWEQIQVQKRRNLQSVIHHRRSNYSECSSDSDPDNRARSPDLQDLVHAPAFVPRSNASPIPHYTSYAPQQQYPVSWGSTHPSHPELVAVQ